MKTQKNASTENATVETPAQTENLNVENAQPAQPAQPTIEELRIAAKKSFDDYAAVENNPDATDDEIFAAQMVNFAAKNALKKAIAAEKSENEKLAKKQLFENSVVLIAQTFGVTVDSLKSVLEQPAEIDGKPNPIYVAVQTVFGKPVYFAKPGETGKSLTGKSENANGTQKSGTGYAHVYAAMDAGKTYAQMIADGITDSQIRNAANQGKYRKNRETGGYYKA